jgi:hypothetical protein
VLRQQLGGGVALVEGRTSLRKRWSKGPTTSSIAVLRSAKSTTMPELVEGARTHNAHAVAVAVEVLAAAAVAADLVRGREPEVLADGECLVQPPAAGGRDGGTRPSAAAPRRGSVAASQLGARARVVEGPVPRQAGDLPRRDRRPPPDEAHQRRGTVSAARRRRATARDAASAMPAMAQTASASSRTVATSPASR